MADPENKNNGGKMSCHNSLKQLSHLVESQRKAHQDEIKIGLFQILYSNHFAWLNHKDLYTHITKFYELSSTLGALEAEE